jgi:predicted amino acid dehydrogenase
MKTDFVWLVHPLNEKQYEQFADMSGRSVEDVRTGGPAIVDEIRDRETGLCGYAVSTPLLPQELLRKKNVIRQLKMIRDLTDQSFTGTYPIGLGAWWAAVTRKGALASPIFNRHHIVDGYTYTIRGIYHELLAHIPHNGHSAARVCIIGAGTVGSGVSDMLEQIGISHTLFDIIHTGKKNKNGQLIRHVNELNLKDFTICVCCTSSTKTIVDREDIPPGFICIDDSYPHVIPEYEGRIDGGIWRNPNITSKWLVQDGRVYGCLMELIDKARQGRGYRATTWKKAPAV